MIVQLNEKNFNFYCSEILEINKRDSIEYNLNFLKYLKEIEIKSKFIDNSFAVIQENKPVAIFLGNIQKKKNSKLKMYSLSSVFFEGNINLKKKTKKIAINYFEKILKDCGGMIEFEDFLKNGKINIITEYLISKNAKISHKIYKKIDLSKDEKILRESIRKSYKSLINWGEREIEVNIYDKHNILKSNFKSYKKLHFEVAKKQTRSDKSWEIQYGLIKSGNCFLIVGKYQKQIVTGGLFFNNGYVCNYGASVSKRELFEKPLFHNILWKAIQIAKKKKYQFFLIKWGLINKKLTKKEISIDDFKNGFSGDSQISLSISLN